MKKEVGIFLAGVAFVTGGCTTEAPTPTAPVDVLVNCQTGPFDEPYQLFTLQLGQIERVGGITENGTQEVVRIIFDRQGETSIVSETDNVFVRDTPTGGKQILGPIVWSFEGFRKGNTFMFGTSATCANAIPRISPNPIIPQS